MVAMMLIQLTIFLFLLLTHLLIFLWESKASNEDHDPYDSLENKCYIHCVPRNFFFVFPRVLSCGL